MIDPGLTGRVALVTGSNSPLGIGAAISRALAVQGVTVALAFRPTPTPEPAGAGAEVPGPARYAAATASDGRTVLDEVRRTGVPAEIFDVDLADPAACVGLFDRVEAALGPVEILVNNAAYSAPDTFVPDRDQLFHRDSPVLDAAGLDAHLAVNTRAPALLMAEFHRRHLARGADRGRIVNISTDAAPQFPGEVSYGASKYALESLSRSAAQELGPAGITVNTVAPGPIQSGWISDDMLDLCAANPLGRIGQPDDVADIVVFLASDQARWVTGQIIYAGGGKRMY
ncbi:SDR family oxidoreductase [Polymorphospora rubra]|uniref:Putative oxidoreductase YjdA n=1 Tax=Polymorphospora rubra TaxID=338584 RepID=A0A810N9Z2_9ACTN|nr:SDR family oxidoreductase [Polymorphospora rubra]BCJ70057.1 putative oxidoreductase YjdA [Polymorphospora rubra]